MSDKPSHRAIVREFLAMVAEMPPTTCTICKVKPEVRPGCRQCRDCLDVSYTIYLVVREDETLEPKETNV